MIPPPPAGEVPQLPAAAEAEGAGRTLTATVWSFLQLTRPVFLVGGALLYALGAAAASGPIDWRRYVLGQVLVTSVQLATQYANEYFDLEADRAAPHRTWLSGGSGVLPTGLLAPGVALRAATAMASIAVAMAAVMVVVEPVVAAIGVVALLGGWYYSAPPARLVASGWGEIEASVIVAGLTPITGVLLQHPSVPADLWAPIAALTAAHVAMLLALHLPDLSGDAATGKRTLAVRLGLRPTRVAIGVALAGAALVTADWRGLLGLPLAVVVAVRPVAYTLLTTVAVATTAAFTVGFLIGGG